MCIKYCFSLFIRKKSCDSIDSNATTVKTTHSITDENEKIIYYDNPILKFKKKI